MCVRAATNCTVFHGLLVSNGSINFICVYCVGYPISLGKEKLTKKKIQILYICFFFHVLYCSQTVPVPPRPLSELSL